eukprot:gene24787-biopygen1404
MGVGLAGGGPSSPPCTFFQPRGKAQRRQSATGTEGLALEYATLPRRSTTTSAAHERAPLTAVTMEHCLGETAVPASVPRPARDCYSQCYRVPRVRSVSAVCFPTGTEHRVGAGETGPAPRWYRRGGLAATPPRWLTWRSSGLCSHYIATHHFPGSASRVRICLIPIVYPDLYLANPGECPSQRTTVLEQGIGGTQWGGSKPAEDRSQRRTMVATLPVQNDPRRFKIPKAPSAACVPFPDALCAVYPVPGTVDAFLQLCPHWVVVVWYCCIVGFVRTG